MSKFFDSQELARHQATVAFELEVLAKKLDRFGWDRDRNSAAHDRLIRDWIAALQDFPLEEVQAACREWVRKNPRKMCNEGDIRNLIEKARHEEWLKRRAALPTERPAQREPKTPESRARVQRITDDFVAARRMQA